LELRRLYKMDQTNTATKTTATPSISVPTGTKALAKTEKQETKQAPSVLRITKLAKEACLEMETNGPTTILKLDKYRIEMYGNIKLNIR
jgi:hypothetical protein